jgi:hypothetical protein
MRKAKLEVAARSAVLTVIFAIAICVFYPAPLPSAACKEDTGPWNYNCLWHCGRLSHNSCYPAHPAATYDCTYWNCQQVGSGCYGYLLDQISGCIPVLTDCYDYAVCGATRNCEYGSAC